MSSQSRSQHCDALTVKGHNCRNFAMKGEKLCFQHKKKLSNIVEPVVESSQPIVSSISRSQNCDALTINGHNCRNFAMKGEKLCFQHKKKLSNNIVEPVVVYQPVVCQSIDVCQPVVSLKCCGKSIIGNKLGMCNNFSNEKYCEQHKHRYRLDKSDECAICMEHISCETETPLECGHWFHKSCLRRADKKCPLCREQLKQHEIKYIFQNRTEENNQGIIERNLELNTFNRMNFNEELIITAESIIREIERNLELNTFNQIINFNEELNNITWRSIVIERYLLGQSNFNQMMYNLTQGVRN